MFLVVVRTFFILFLFEMITGCSFQPPYHQPAIDIPKKWAHAEATDQNKTYHISCSKTKWWEQYKQPSLNRFMKQALQENNEFKKSIVNIDYAEQELTRIKFNWLPNAGILGGISQFPIFANPGGFLMAAPIYVINIFQQYHQQKSTQQKVFASIYAKDAARLMVIAQMELGYFTLIAEKESMILYQRLLDDMQTDYKLSEARYRYGLISKDDLVMITSRIETIRAELTVVQNNIVLSQNALRVLMNKNPGDLAIQESFRDLDSNGFVPDNTPLSTIQNRPDVKQKEALLKASYADVDAAIANLLPTVTVGAYLGSGSTTHGPFRLIEAYPVLPIDLSLYPNIGAHKARFKAMYFDYINTVRMALREIDDSLSSYHQRSNQLSHLQLSLTEAEQHCDLTNKRFKFGIVNQSDANHCQIKLDEIRLLVNQIKLEKMLSLVKLHQHFAGGCHEL
jgi:multidrug efflux system outer membrane protein